MNHPSSPRHGGRSEIDGLPLDERARDIIDFERNWRVHEGRKEAAIQEYFGISSARYYQVLNRLIKKPAAAVYDPLTVRRLRRRRAERLRRSIARVAGDQPPSP